jgi:queuine tRNA-ribosyltransferase
MFDCVMPTRNARNGMFTANGTINIKKKMGGFFPIDDMGITFVDTEYTKAYLRHLLLLMNILKTNYHSQSWVLCGWFVRLENIS